MFKVKRYGEGIFTDKTKIFFCCHENDIGFLDEISEDILDVIDCSVYYDENFSQTVDMSEREFLLSQMQLFVVPVTEKLLSTPSRAVDFDLKIARKKRIPVLPIMCDKNLVSLFSERFGAFQYLDRNSEDETEIDYKSKLRAFLSEIVVSEESFMNILSVFRAMIFLSYRKKDRRKAQELIKRIHKNSDLYDVGIWYDEFLKPGENFNEQIDFFLQGSDLFVLAVTPSLLEKGNYVERVEYPQALEYDKKILPVMLSPTETGELKSHYKGLNGVVDMADESFDEKFNEAIGTLPELWEEDILEHKYNVALAYLNGIGVELDREVGIRLLHECAEDGYEFAMDALAKTYLWGKGVSVDIDEGLKWRKKLIDKNRSLNADFPDKQSAYLVTSKFVQEAGEYLKYCYSLKKTDETQELLGELQTQLDAVRAKFPIKKGDDFRLQGLLDSSLNAFYTLLGTQSVAEKRYDDAEKAFLSLESLTVSLTECQFKMSGYNGPIPQDKLYHLRNMSVYPLLGDLYNRMERYAEAEEKLAVSVAELDKIAPVLASAPSSEREAMISKFCFVRSMLALSKTNLGKYDEANNLYSAVEADLKRLVSASPTVHTPTLIALYCSIAELNLKRKEKSTAQEFIEKAERTLASFNGNKDLITNLKSGIEKIKANI